MKIRARSTSDERGVSIIETVVSMLILTTVVMGLLSTSGWANRATAVSRRDLQWWAALQWKADSLMGVDSATVVAGSDTVNGYPVSWNVYPGALTRVEVIVVGESILNGDEVSDTLMVYLPS